MIRTLIIDDEQHARDELAVLLSDTGEFELLGTCANAMEAIKAINRDHPAVIFLDVNMPVLSGFDLLGMIDQEQMPYVVFVTAYDEYALKAFEEKTLDYLLKPVEPARLDMAIRKIKGALEGGNRQSFDTHPLTRIPCVTANRIRLVDLSQIEYVHSDLSGVHVVGGGTESYTELTLKVLESRSHLTRCHRQYLVNPDQIDEITLLEHGLAEIRTRSGHRLPVSRRYLKRLKELLSF